MWLKHKQCLAILSCALLFILGAALGACGKTQDINKIEPQYAIQLHHDDEKLHEILQQTLVDYTRDLTLPDHIETTEDQERYAAFHTRQMQSLLRDRLRAEGFYESDIKFKPESKQDDKDKTEKRVQPEFWQGQFEIDSGARYRITAIRIEGQNGLSNPQGLLEELEIAAGHDLNADRVLAAQRRLQRLIERDSCRFSHDISHGVILDDIHHGAEVIFRIEQGADAVFGATAFEGADSVRRSYLRNHMNWQEGECFRRDRIEAFRTSLFETGLFSSVETILPDQPQQDGIVPITFILKERAQRTISTGLGFYTDEGVLATAGWEHRNFLGAGELFRAQLNMSQWRQNVESSLNKPFFMRKDQSLGLDAKLGREDFDSFTSVGVETGAALKRQLNRRLSVSTGVTYGITNVRDKATGEKDSYGLVSLPQTVTYDSRNDVLDPERGWLLTGKVAPFIDSFGESDPFFKTEIGARTYVPLHQSTIFALRTKIGSLLGSDTVNIPPTQRYYAGGGGSARGFGFQEVGPQLNNKPLGGRSVIELSAEMRFRFSDEYGGVLFIDSASLSDETTPDFKNVAVGVGAGLRYYSDFGPIRFDVGVPVRNKENTSRNVQFYISIGQAF